MNPFKLLLLVFACTAILSFTCGCAMTETGNTEAIAINILETWSGDFPVSELGRLPAGQQNTMTGYIGDKETFISVWQVFQEGNIVPEIDFSKNIIVFSRNVQFYNRTAILKVMLQNGAAEIFAMETMSAIPIEDKVAMAMAVIPRKDIRFIQTGSTKIEVLPYK